MTKTPTMRRAIVIRLQMIQTNSHSSSTQDTEQQKKIKRQKSNSLICLQAKPTLPLVAIVNLSPDSDKISNSEKVNFQLQESRN